MFVRTVPDSRELAEIYSSNDYYVLPRGSINRIKIEAKRRLGILTKYISKGSYFDIGCAKGWQLDEARTYGFDTSGIDLSCENVRFCREKDHKVMHGYLEDFVDNVHNECFEAISCLDVIEHVEDPIRFLSTATSILSKDGVMVVSTPNYSGVVARMLGHRDPYMIPPEHLNFFTGRGMRNLFKQVGLKQLRSITFGTLTRSERGRVISKYFPRFLTHFEPAINPLIPLGVRLLNILRMGMEQEFYLVRGDR